MKVEDHWPVPLLGGECRLVENDGLITAIEFTKAGLPPNIAMSIDDTPTERAVATIRGRDTLLPVVRDHIGRAFSFLQCYFDTKISAKAVKIHYDAETPDEERLIDIPSIDFGKKEVSPLPLTYDFITRALMAAEDDEGPEFVSSLASMSRESLSAGRYIDSFRFSFLLIESLFGQGKFKSKQLKEVFLSAPPLVRAINHALSEWKLNRVTRASATLTLMQSHPTVEQIVDHLISMRGHYFHGNIGKKDAWHPSKQEEAEALAWLGIDISQQLAGDAAQPMFQDKFAKRHYEEAKLAGAHVVMDIEYQFRVPEDNLLRRNKIRFRMPGTKPTTLMAMEAAWRSVQDFRDKLPVGRLHSVTAKNATDGAELFHIRFYTEEDGPVVGG